MITTSDFVNILGTKVGEQLNARFDLFQLLSPDTKKLKRLIFEFEQLHIEGSQGEAILEFLQWPKDITVDARTYLSSSILSNIDQRF